MLNVSVPAWTPDTVDTAGGVGPLSSLALDLKWAAVPGGHLASTAEKATCTVLVILISLPSCFVGS
jgi:hypothetical protein